MNPIDNNINNNNIMFFSIHFELLIVYHFISPDSCGIKLSANRIEVLVRHVQYSLTVWCRHHLCILLMFLCITSIHEYVIIAWFYMNAKIMTTRHNTRPKINGRSLHGHSHVAIFAVVWFDDGMYFCSPEPRAIASPFLCSGFPSAESTSWALLVGRYRLLLCVHLWRLRPLPSP